MPAAPGRGRTGPAAERVGPQILIPGGEISVAGRAGLRHAHPLLLGSWRRARARSTDRGCTRDPEPVCDHGGQAGGTQRGIFLHGLLAAKSTISPVSLCARRGPGRLCQQSGKPVGIEGLGCGIPARPGEPERRRGRGHRLALEVHPAHHLVLHLHQVPGVEEPPAANASSVTASGRGLSARASRNAVTFGSSGTDLATGPPVNYMSVSSIMPMIAVDHAESGATRQVTLEIGLLSCPAGEIHAAESALQRRRN